MNPQYKTFDEIPWWNRDRYTTQPSYGRSQAQPMMQQMQQPMNYAASYRPQGLLGGSNKNPGTLGAEMYTNYVNNLLMQNAPQVAPQPPQQQGMFGFSEPKRMSWHEHLADRGGGSA